MSKADCKKEFKLLYNLSSKDIQLVDVWSLMIMQPDVAASGLPEQALRQIEKRNVPLLSKIRLERL